RAQQPRMLEAEQHLHADVDHEHAHDAADADRHRDEVRDREDQHEEAERALAERIEELADRDLLAARRFERAREQRGRAAMIRAAAHSAVGPGTRSTSSLSMRGPSRSTTSKRKPLQSKCSPASGMRPKCAMIMPAAVRKS